MTLPPALARASDQVVRLLARRSHAVAIALKLLLVFGVGALTSEGIALMRAYFETHPDAQNLVTDIILDILKWGVGAAVVFYGLAWIGRKAGLREKIWRRIDRAGSVILGILAGSLVAVMVLLFFSIAYIFIRQVAMILYNVMT